MPRWSCRHRRWRTRVELDGELGHPGGRTASDTWRDGETVIDAGELMLRYRWEHVAGAPCVTAGQVARGLRLGGWPGTLHRCSPSCGLPPG